MSDPFQTACHFRPGICRTLGETVWRPAFRRTFAYMGKRRYTLVFLFGELFSVYEGR